VVCDVPPGDHRRRVQPADPGAERAVLPQPAARLPARRVGQQAVDGHRLPGGAGAALRRGGAALAAGQRGAAARVLGWLSAGAARAGVLARPGEPPARPVALPAGCRSLDHRAAIPLTWGVAFYV